MGFVAIGDVRDFFAGVFQGEWVGAGLSVAGLIPLLGDSAKALDTISDFTRRLPVTRVDDVVRWVLKQDWVPDLAKRGALRLVDGAGGILARGIDGLDEDVLMRLVKGGRTDLRAIDNALEAGAEVRRGADFVTAGGNFTRGGIGEDFVRGQLGVTKPTTRIDTPHGPRYPDAEIYDTNGVLTEIHEVKTAFPQNIDKQLEKDIWIASDRGVDLVWHFVPVGENGLDVASDALGAPPAVLEQLTSSGVHVVFWVP